ncbi:type VI secretion system-associated protein TagF [Variovorax dokdonensis]|uniref:Type VI secretion system-associated protein TagF n=1 Tax=Variovorax dokdonensis TaxID=344883 RepID=A0ABT7NAJ1_9BURK|nr:type VI secretion system-associated protein TagF [Variovorax dokdonensis]MDM0044947.1 type VI secretion system-associated protein TagF [Variovorax dokdonensis]
MSDTDTSRIEAHALPGWWGKLPGMGDFAHRRLPDAFRHDWDRWLQGGLQQLRARHANWNERYLQAPLWCFILGDGVIGEGAWIGVLMPSVDAVGRYFPFTVVDSLKPVPAELHGQWMLHALRWFELAAQCAIDGLEQDLDAPRFEALLHQRFAPGAIEDPVPGQDAADALALPEYGQSLWFTDPQAQSGQGMSTLGLPQDEQFDALFGFPTGEGLAEEGPAP